jgi:hypothetical protein
MGGTLDPMAKVIAIIFLSLSGLVSIVVGIALMAGGSTTSTPSTAAWTPAEIAQIRPSICNAIATGSTVDDLVAGVDATVSASTREGGHAAYEQAVRIAAATC